MYNLLVSGDPGYWSRGYVDLPRDKFRGFLDQQDAIQFGDMPLKDLATLPALFVSGTVGMQIWQLGQFSRIASFPKVLSVEFELDSEPHLDAEEMVRISRELGIDPDTELAGTHWTIKTTDLLDVFLRWDLVPVETGKPPRAKPEHDRRTVAAALQLLHFASRSHVIALVRQTGREIGLAETLSGRRTLVEDFGRWVLANPGRFTGKGQPLWDFTVEAVTELFQTWVADGPSKLGVEPFQEFLAALEAKRWVVVSGVPLRTISSDQATNLKAKPTGGGATQAETQDTRRMDNMPIKVFLVHGRDAAMKETVARFLERIGVHAVILHEQPNKGRTLFTKFQEVAGETSFAIALLHPDDVGGLSGQTQHPRARQNVILELGFFIGRLGADRVAALVNGHVERPSDFDGVVYIDYGDGKDWRSQLARELQAAGVPFDVSKVVL